MPRLTYSAVASTAALVIALGGTSVAAVSMLPRHSVGTQQLRDNAVTSGKIRNGAVEPRDLAFRPVPTSARVGIYSIGSPNHESSSAQVLAQLPRVPLAAVPRVNRPSVISVSATLERDANSSQTGAAKVTCTIMGASHSVDRIFDFGYGDQNAQPGSARSAITLTGFTDPGRSSETIGLGCSQAEATGSPRIVLDDVTVIVQPVVSLGLYDTSTQ